MATGIPDIIRMVTRIHTLTVIRIRMAIIRIASAHGSSIGQWLPTAGTTSYTTIPIKGR